jgi:molybdenum cofactor cytidylyltransferase
MICAVVLAAGNSNRMGTQKLLLPLGDKPVIARVVDELLLGPVKNVLVVVGRDGEKIKQVLQGREVTFVLNPDPEGDMLSSVRCGLRALPEACEAVLVALGDQPAINHELIGELIRAFHQRGRGIIVPAHGNHRGHPILFASHFSEEVLTRYDGVGLHGLLDAHPDEVFKVPVSTASVLEDMDTPEDYERQKSRISTN